MKAIIYPKYGSPDVLQLTELEKPVPAADQLLVKIEAASTNPYDWHHMRGAPFLVRLQNGFLKPNSPLLGADVAGVVEAVGRDVTGFQVGDEVFGSVSIGGFAQYAAASEKVFAHKPAGLPFTEAAAVPIAALTALQGLRDTGQIQAGKKVLINGASGGVGTYAVQLAKYFGAEVTGVCSTRNLEMVRSLGADHVIDYTQENFTRNGQQYDLILENIANHSIPAYRRALSPQGICVMIGFSSLFHILQVLTLGSLASKMSDQTITMMMARIRQADLRFLAELLENGRLVSVIDRCYPFRETAEAIRYLEKGHARGKVVIAEMG